MPIRALLLDAGGTLVTEKRSRAEMYAEVAARHGLRVAPERMRECMARAHAALPRVLDGHPRYSKPWFEAFIADVLVRQLDLPPSELPAAAAELFAAFADPRSFRLLPGARELLAAARARDLRLALVSNWSPAMAGVLRGLGVLDAFQAVLISADEGVEKPEREIFERALARLNVRAPEALHVGNDPVQDVRGASACGLHALLFDPDAEHAALGLESVRTLAELIPWIEKQR